MRDNYILVTGNKNKKKYGIKKVRATGVRPTTTTTTVTTKRTTPKCELKPNIILVRNNALGGGSSHWVSGEFRIKKRDLKLENEYHFREYGMTILSNQNKLRFFFIVFSLFKEYYGCLLVESEQLTSNSIQKFMTPEKCNSIC